MNVKAYENVAQAAGGAASTTGLGWSAAGKRCSVGDSSTGMHLLIGLLCCFAAWRKTGRGQQSHHVNAGCRTEP
ncbi:CoA transferase [Escherichia coli]